MTVDTQLPPIAVTVTHRVADFDAWRAGFDANKDARQAASVLGHHLNRHQDDPDVVTVYLAANNIEAVSAFITSDELRADMERLGVVSAPEVRWMTPVNRAVVWDRQLPAFIASHRVADFDVWLAGYSDADELRASKGIIGHGASRSLDDPSLVILYHQAESFDALRAFFADEDLRASMTELGATSEPEVDLVIGGWSQRY